MTTDRTVRCFWIRDFVKRKLRAMQTSYDEYADLADVHGGPAVIETFGEKPFSPVSKPESWDVYRSTAEASAGTGQ